MPATPAASREQPNTIAVKAVLVLDLVDSTKLVEHLGDERAVDLLRHHDRLARDVVARHGGREIDKTDGFLLLFESPTEAIECALSYHEELARLARSWDVSIRARAGVHIGKVFLRENSPRDVQRGAKPLEVEGLTKLIAARVMSLALGGQTLLTRAVYELTYTTLSAKSDQRLRWLPHGLYRLKGIGKAVEIFEVGFQGSAPLMAPPDTPKARRRWRALPAVAMIGAIFVAMIFLLYRQVSGPGGAGGRPSLAVLGFKNLSVETESDWLSTALAELFATELAAGEDLRLIPGVHIARMKQEVALSETAPITRGMLDKIRQRLGSDYVLTGSFLKLKQGAGDQLRVLLVLQETIGGQTIASVSETSAQTDLFELVSRAGGKLRSKLNLGELSPVKSAAARASVSASPSATRLYSEGLLKLRNYDASAARDLLREAVDADADYAQAHSALSEAWLALGYDGLAEESARRAFELARDFRREEYLSIKGRYEEASAKWEQAEETYKILWGYFPDNIEYGLRLTSAQISADRGQDALATVEVLRTLPGPEGVDPRIDLKEGRAFYLLSNPPRYLAAYEKAIEKGKALESRSLVAEGRLFQGWGLSFTGKIEAAVKSFEEAQRLFAEVGDRGRAAEALNGIGYLIEKEGNHRHAEEIFRGVLSIHREIENRKHVSWDLLNIAVLVRKKGDLKQAEALLQESIQLAREVGAWRREAVSLQDLALVLLDQGDLAGAKELARQSLRMLEETNQRWDLAWASIVLGDVALAAGEITDAQVSYEKALEICREIAAKSVSAFALLGSGESFFIAGDLVEAQQRFEQALTLRSELGEKGTQAETHLALARLSLELGQATKAGTLARQAMTAFSRQQRHDAHSAATMVVVSALLVQGDVSAAKDTFSGIRALARRSQNPRIRLSAALTDAGLLLVSGDAAGASRRLNSVREEALELGLVGFELEARLVLAEVESASGRTAGQARLRLLGEEASSVGYGLIAKKAAAAAGN